MIGCDRLSDHTGFQIYTVNTRGRRQRHAGEMMRLLYRYSQVSAFCRYFVGSLGVTLNSSHRPLHGATCNSLKQISSVSVACLWTLLAYEWVLRRVSTSTSEYFEVRMHSSVQIKPPVISQSWFSYYALQKCDFCRYSDTLKTATVSVLIRLRAQH